MDTSKIISLLGDKSDYYLNHVCKTIDKSLLHLPSPTCVDDVWVLSIQIETYRLSIVCKPCWGTED